MVFYGPREAISGPYRNAKENSAPTVIKTKITVYHNVKGQCNADFLHSADNTYLGHEPFEKRIVAISRDLEGFLSMGDSILVLNAGEYSGKWYVHDRMNKRHQNSIDLLINKGMPLGVWSGSIVLL